MTQKLGFFRLHNAELIEYLTQFLALLQGQGAFPPPLQEALARLRTRLSELEALHKTDPASLLTQSLIDADEERDNLYTGLLSFARSFTFHNDPALREAGRSVLHVIELYGKAGEMVRRPYAEESTDIASLLDHLEQPECSAAAQRIGAAVFTLPLKEANDRFRARFAARNDEAAQREYAFTMVGKRKEAGTDYDLVLRKLNAAFEMDEAAWKDTAVRCNALTKRFRDQVAARVGRAAARNEARTETQA